MYLIDESGTSVEQYLDLRSYAELDILAHSWAGFQSFAFHPDFASSGKEGFGKFYTVLSSTATTAQPDFSLGGDDLFHTLLLEWRTDDPTAASFTPADNDAPYREVIRFQQPTSVHNGGLVAFSSAASQGGPDYGNLYLSMGDGGFGQQHNAQNESNPYGAILRIDPLGNDSATGNYGIVQDNLFADDSDEDTLAEIYSFGFRNPQRFGWDVATGSMYVADIGEDAIEEINLAMNGGNYGWPAREGGTAMADQFIDPVAEYDHTNVVPDPPTSSSAHAVTVGDVARGTGIPDLDGVLVLSDFIAGLLFTLDVDSDPLDGGQDGLSELLPYNDLGQQVRMLDLINEARSERGLSNTNRADIRFGVNTPGEVYVLNKHDGIIRRLTGAVAGDYNGDGEVDMVDYNVWREQFGASGPATADGNGDGVISLADYTVWRDQSGASLAGGTSTESTPEPAAFCIVACSSLALMYLRFGRR